MYSHELSTQPISDVSRDAIVVAIQEAVNCSGTALEDYKDYCNTTFMTQEVEKSFIQLEVYFSTLTTEDIQVVSAYSVLALLCDIGGALGLILGSTILTVFEFLDFFLVAGAHAAVYRASKRRNKKVSATENKPEMDRNGTFLATNK